MYAAEILSDIPTSAAEVVFGGDGVEPYFRDPDRWHAVLYNFMALLNCTRDN